MRRALMALSERLARLETRLLQALIATILGLMILNVVSRALRQSLYWVDELAINLMVIAAFVGSSLMFAQRQHFCVTLLRDALPRRGRTWLSLAVQCTTLCFAVFLAYASWLWFDPLTLAAHGFDLDAFFSQTFNSIYREITNTIGIERFWFFFVMPLFAVSLTLHSLASVAEDIGALAAKEPEPC
ncbi:MAG: TRAP transporter small permease subunit [Pseudomonadota bacterium]